ncbi:MAG: TetR/AcrR family transcriptional regulator [Pseudomonadota bacterium]
MSSAALTTAAQSAFGSKTKGRILLVSLDLFNRFGFERVTTAQLAEAAEILEGTLWYHFKAKKDLPLAHLDALEATLEKHLDLSSINGPDDIAEHMIGTFDLLWDFRYLLREPIAVIQEEADGRARLKRIYEYVERRIEGRLLQIEAMGWIDLSNANVNTLAVSCFLIGRYWLDYATIRFGDDLDARAFRRIGIHQLVSLLTPYLLEEGKKRVPAARQR